MTFLWMSRCGIQYLFMGGGDDDDDMVPTEWPRMDHGDLQRTIGTWVVRPKTREESSIYARTRLRSPVRLR